MRHSTSLIFAACLVVLPIASARAQNTLTASASATASRVGRASSFQTGKKIRVRKNAKATFRGRASAELMLRKKGLVAIQMSASERLAAATRAQAAAEASLRTKARARASAEAKLTASLKALDQAKAALEAKVKARGSAEVELKSARADQAELQAKAQGSISISISFDGSKKKKAKARVKSAEAKDKSAKAEEAKAKQKVETAKTAHDKASADTEKAKEAEKVAEESVSDCKEQTTEAKEEVVEANEAVTEANEELAEEPAPADTVEVVVEAAPDKPSDNAFGYEKPVWGCFEGKVMFIEKNSPKLPADYAKYNVASRLYACEWDVPTRAFEQGFPGVTDQFEWFAIVYSGMFNVSAAGTYQFRINSDDGTKLYIDGNPVVMNDGVHPPKSVSGSVTLSAGDHELVLEYFQGPRYLIALQVWVTPPGGSEQIFSVR
jgi:hypothetical protein